MTTEEKIRQVLRDQDIDGLLPIDKLTMHLTIALLAPRQRMVYDALPDTPGSLTDVANKLGWNLNCVKSVMYPVLKNSNLISAAPGGWHGRSLYYKTPIPI